MNHPRDHKWLRTIFLAACGFFFLGCIGYLWIGAMNPECYWQPVDQPSSASMTAVPPEQARLLLTKNQAVQLNDARIAYRGVCGGDRILDLYILQLDPHDGYLHRIDVQLAHS